MQALPLILGISVMGRDEQHDDEGRAINHVCIFGNLGVDGLDGLGVVLGAEKASKEVFNVDGEVGAGHGGYDGLYTFSAVRQRS